MDLDERAKRVALYAVRSRKITRLLLIIPGLVVAFTLFSGVERTPLTGRWRLILLSPWEEDDIASQLAGPGWYTAVGEILSAGGQKPKLIDPSDWRYKWVQQTLRRLEAVIPVLQAEKDLRPDWTAGGEAVPLPPPSEFPLTQRFWESEHFARLNQGEDPHTVMKSRSKDRGENKPIHGPPYSLLVVDEPDAANAFSYGFGPDGAAGIVLFSGFLDDISRKYPFDSVAAESHGEERSWWSTLLGSFFGAKPAPRLVPSEEQTSELAILLAHEVAHLLLAHHIETLSVGSIVGPSVMNIVTDVIRTFMFPFTMLFGPFINDALSGVWKTSSAEFAKYSGICTSHDQEIEADIVSARLLAHAGFDPRHAVRFWETRSESAPNGECAHAPKEEVDERGPIRKLLPHRWTGSSYHPLNIERVRKLKKELKRWEAARRRAREDEERRHGREARAAPAWWNQWGAA
ncbi:hypothetical protein FOMPIDRAFT_1021371 [Fomitopsis schrenkii]|uniref:Peptidase M48 domain-containing protein n=1 Tax=Fomitopsis schrenkii TaxID=2126942 RepID=S8EK94_FOMSC|nr:hypothetical protein FOMPIDRAFT_1021371 [Fomitopsis schrenkii]